MTSSDPNAFVFYRYHPSLVAAAIFVACFAITTLLHIVQAARARTYYFIPLIIGGLLECIGYVGRALAHNNETNMSIFIMQTLTLLVAPALFAASIYMILGRLVLATRGESLAPIRASRLTKIFVCGDVVAFLVQAGGGGLMAQQKTQDSGKFIVLAGLFIQIIFFGIFVITSSIFHKRLAGSPTQESLVVPRQKYMFALYFASLLILIRSVFRVLEFAGGNTGPLESSEVYLYVFDAILMLGVMVGFNIVHPGAIIGRKAQKDSILLSDRESGRGGLNY
ncbi:Protein RTA1 [Lachnellula subtilissima]|uniref:Protein RTA1 n=1 Tax=Lachnellula subtilissima TaxID=602034 RepID=A0A8H8U6Q3_9HELO|nr:Protein RTA1 [Lachnellula subtilissima]